MIKPPTACKDCLSTLTSTEERFLDDRCELCEQEWLEEVTGWRQGEEDKRLDKLFSISDPVKH